MWRGPLEVKKGDRVTIYMPMIPEAVFAMLACARIGAIHSVVFAGFSADSLRDRIVDDGLSVRAAEDLRSPLLLVYNKDVNSSVPIELGMPMIVNAGAYWCGAYRIGSK